MDLSEYDKHPLFNVIFTVGGPKETLNGGQHGGARVVLAVISVQRRS